MRKFVYYNKFQTVVSYSWCPCIWSTLAQHWCFIIPVAKVKTWTTLKYFNKDLALLLRKVQQNSVMPRAGHAFFKLYKRSFTLRYFALFLRYRCLYQLTLVLIYMRIEGLNERGDGDNFRHTSAYCGQTMKGFFTGLWPLPTFI